MAAQLMVLYDEAKQEHRTEAAHAYAVALNVLRNETKGVRVTWNGPPPILRTVPRLKLPAVLGERLPATYRPSPDQLEPLDEESSADEEEREGEEEAS